MTRENERPGFCSLSSTIPSAPLAAKPALYAGHDSRQMRFDNRVVGASALLFGGQETALLHESQGSKAV